jgi:DNA-3-methyladenine glycosylase II
MLDYINHFKGDPILHTIVASQPSCKLQIKKDLFSYLCASIIGQQLSTKVAEIIRQRFFALFEESNNLPFQILQKEIVELRSVGLSNSKVQYIKNIASFYLENKSQWDELPKKTDEEIILFLTQIKGVGKWTVEMLLMFAMGRDDVFPDDDLGIQQAMIRLYKIDAANKRGLKEEMNRIAASWSPFRTYACLHLWKWKDS